MRGASQITMIAVPEDADYLRLQLDLETGNYADFRSELKSQPGNQLVWRSGKLRATDTGTSKVVVVRLPAGLLKSQAYIVELSGISSDSKADVVGRYLFEVKKP